MFCTDISLLHLLDEVVEKERFAMLRADLYEIRLMQNPYDAAVG